MSMKLRAWLGLDEKVLVTAPWGVVYEVVAPPGTLAAELSRATLAAADHWDGPPPDERLRVRKLEGAT